jgi:hypothetical protein
VTYVGLSMRKYFGMRRAEAVTIAIAFLFFAGGLRSAAANSLPAFMSPSFGYLPALTALLACGVLLALRRHPAALWLLAAGGIFVVSLTFRALDQQVCDSFALGTHFMWHILNAVVLGTLLFGFLRHGTTRIAAAQ